MTKEIQRLPTEVPVVIKPRIKMRKDGYIELPDGLLMETIECSLTSNGVGETITLVREDGLVQYHDSENGMETLRVEDMYEAPDLKLKNTDKGLEEDKT